jgi:hypothetical protein
MMRAGGEIPIHVDQPNLYNPIHEDDYIAQVPRLLAVASVPAVTVNRGEPASIEDWCGHLSELPAARLRPPPTRRQPAARLDAHAQRSVRHACLARGVRAVAAAFS